MRSVFLTVIVKTSEVLSLFSNLLSELLSAIAVSETI